MDAKPDENAVPSVINGRTNGRFAKGFSGNPGGSPEATRRAFNKDFLVALARDFQAHGEQVLARVRRESPASYLKVCAMLVPRQMQVEHAGGVKAMSDQQLEDGDRGNPSHARRSGNWRGCQGCRGCCGGSGDPNIGDIRPSRASGTA